MPIRGKRNAVPPKRKRAMHGVFKGTANVARLHEAERKYALSGGGEVKGKPGDMGGQAMRHQPPRKSAPKGPLSGKTVSVR